MAKRALSALVGVGIFLGLCFGGLLPFAIGTTLVAGLATWEWIAAYQRAPEAEVKAGAALRLPAWQNGVNILLVCAGLVFPLLAYAAQQKNNGLGKWSLMDGINAFALFAPVLWFALRTRQAAHTGRVLGGMRRWYGLVGFVYIGLLMSSLVWMRGLTLHFANTSDLVSYPWLYVSPFEPVEVGAWLMLFVAVCVWATDTGAYLFGKRFGRRKLAPTLSPGKTVEGSLGGVALALLTSALFGAWIHLPLGHSLVIGAIAGIMGQWGDLFESALKRELGVKDFGNIMPGHGGALDRFDSLLFVTPLAFCYLHFLAGY